MEYTEAVDREIEALEVFEKKSGLTEVGKKKIKALRKCRDDFKKLHLPVVNYRTWTVDEIVEELKDIDAFDAAKYFFDKYGS